ncbi:MAG: DUF4367 domain-containing protein [Clostridia bacterium]|nr:DUF4367 domain-containing protein [Lachnospiraceae bacterium]NCC01302.1 DUF4367 domain-containing protein [Clostridia bacterium]NCD03149.1 DUF4367 domain-containing protein [Clostridia bacterium]
MSKEEKVSVGLSKKDTLKEVSEEHDNASNLKKSETDIDESSENLYPFNNKRGDHTPEEESAEDMDLKRISAMERAVERFLEDEVEPVSDGEENPRVFSQEYEARKQQMLQKAFDSKEEKPAKKGRGRFAIPATVAAALAVLTISLALSTNAALAMPEPIRQLVMHVQSLFSSASIDDLARYGSNQVSDTPQEIQTVYEPAVVLDGYEESEREIQEKRVVIRYVSDNQESYSFQQRPLIFWSGYNQEELVYEDVTVAGEYSGITYIKNSQRHLQWQQEGYVFELAGDEDALKKLMKIAASIKPVEEKNEKSY